MPYSDPTKRKEYSKQYSLQNKERMKKTHSAWREKNKDRLLKKRNEYYTKNKEMLREKSKKYREENYEKVKLAKKKYYAAHREEICKNLQEWKEQNPERYKKAKQDWYQRNRELNAKQNKVWKNNNAAYCKRYMKRWRAENIGRIRAQMAIARLKCLRHYSGPIPKCSKCGVIDVRFLELDHVADNGKSSRKKHGGTRTYYNYLVKNDFPDCLQVLCSYHNRLKKRIY